MRRAMLSLLLIATMVCSLFAQSTWRWQNPLPQGNNLSVIQSVDSLTTYAAGELGACVQTTDGGATWRLLTLPVPLKAQSMQFIDTQHGWLAGAHGDSLILLRTTNAGENWSELLKVRGRTIAFQFITTATALLAVDSTLLRSSDGGISWLVVLQGVPISKIHFINQTNGWMIGGATVSRTTNGGNSWASTQTSLGSWATLSTIRFVDPTYGWLMGQGDSPNYRSGHLLKSTDGGATWIEKFSIGGSFVYDWFTDIAPVDRDTCRAMAAFSSFYKTTDGGSSWSEITRVPYLKQLSTINKKKMLGAGSYGCLFVSTNAGTTWSRTSPGHAISYPSDLMVLDSLNVFAVGGKTMLKTSDAGMTWNASTVFAGPGYFDARAVWFADGQNGWIGAESSGGWGGLHRTTDGGQSWVAQVDHVHRIFGIFFLDHENGWFGSGDTIYATTDGGNTWAVRGATSSVDLEVIQFVSSTVGWAGGYIGLRRSTDRGTTWAEVRPAGLSLYTKAIFFLDPLNGWIAGNGGQTFYICRTTDGGTSWSSYAINDQLSDASIHFIDGNRGWATVIGVARSYLLETTDGGIVWQSRELPAPSLKCVRFSKNGNGWLLGSGGAILHTRVAATTVDDLKVVGEFPARFELAQNYPNPFNPVTTINYQLPIGNSQLTILKVFDLLGREVATLVNEVKRPGAYTVQCDATGFASGVYIYRLQAGSFSATRKLLFIK